MSENPFDKLAPFLQEYIYAHKWTELRAIQVEASRVILETDAHLLLATGTASGKTEAAFLPALTILHNDPAATLRRLYQGPTQALINDQFIRLNDLLQEAQIPGWHWHGDVLQSHKTNLLSRIPKVFCKSLRESLESLLINKSTQLVRLFGDLRFVIIDEVHVFMGSGSRTTSTLPTSATSWRTLCKRGLGVLVLSGNASVTILLAEDWLKSGTDCPVVTPRVQGPQQTIRLSVEHMYVPRLNNTEDDAALPLQIVDIYTRYLFEISRERKKCLIFANSRGETESVIATLRQIAEFSQNLTEHILRPLHGQHFGPRWREAAEEAMRDPDRPAVTAATVTLELGIDIGQLDRIVQLGAPHSVSSFLQRLGRSGRRGQPSEMWFAFSDFEPAGKESLPDQIPWEFLHCIAIIQLYLEERWIEPIHPVKYPVSLLYHQTMSTLASLGELTPAVLAQRVLTLSPFGGFSQDDYKAFLIHLLRIGHIQKTEEQGLIVGLAGEQIVRNFRFYAVFPDNEEFSVKCDSEEIGSITTPPPPGDRFALAGRTWEVVEIDMKRKTVHAKQV